MNAIIEHLDDDILHLTLNRPDAYNAIDPALRDQVIEVLEGARGQGARAILIRGTGRGFSAGIDLRGSNADLTGMDVVDLMRASTQRLVRSLIDCPIPIVTAVHGACAGVSLVFALASDYCVAGRDARFIASFVQRGLVPDGAACYLLPRLVGAGRARRFLLLGEALPASEAHAFGLIAELTEPEDLEATALGVARRFASLPTAAIAYTKQLLAHSFESSLDAMLLGERSGQALARTTADAQEGIDAFRERREPRFTGH